MTKTRVDYELPYGNVNAQGLRVGVATAIDAVDESEIGIHYGGGHPESISPQHVVGLIFDVEPENVSQPDIDMVTDEVETLLGTAVYERGWGSHDPDYIEQ